MVTSKGMREAGENLVAAGLYLLFAASHVRALAASYRPSLVVVVVVETLVAVLFLLRAPATRASASLYDWMTSVGGTLAPLLLRPADDADVLAGQLVQLAGGALALVSLASLSRSFALLPAVRTLRFGGAYRWVRHPLYLAYTVQNAGYLVSNPTPRNAVVVLVALAFQVLRILNEERVLASIPEYERYMQRTRWRLVPLVF